MNTVKNYNTKQKNTVLNMLIEHQNQHLTVDEMMIKLTEQETPVGRATLYRFLDYLIELGMVKKWIFENKPSGYQYIGKEEMTNYHLKCQACGKLFSLDMPILESVDSAVHNKYGFDIDPGKTVFFGTCGDCRGKH